MKKSGIVIGMLSIVVLSGCATGPVIGPFSYMTAQSNKKAKIRRAAMTSEVLTADQKRQVVGISAYSASPSEIGVAVKVDITELIRGDYTTAEVLKQLAGQAGDVTLYTAIIYGLQALAEDDSEDNGPSYHVSVDGDYNNVNTTQGDNNSSTSDENTSSSGGQSNQDTETGL